jgi:hypothetical protein
MSEPSKPPPQEDQGSLEKFQQDMDDVQDQSLPRTTNSRDERRTMLEMWRSGRRLSDGASLELRNSLEKQISERNLPNWKKTVGSSRSSQTYISCLIDDLQWALTNLDAPVDMNHLEEMAIFIHESQSGDSRGYHHVGRVFEVSAGSSPIQLLAAFFRDTVNHFIDGQLSPRQEQLLQNAFLPNSFKVNPAIFEDDMMRMVAKVFGYEANENLEELIFRWRHGMDVFLSAIVTVNFLREKLTRKQLAEVLACMEGTIPFREREESGELPIDKLYHRLVQVNEEYALEFSEEELELSCQQAADLHNRYLGNFVTTDSHTYLDHLWSLLPEQYASLRRHTLYSLDDFYFAVLDMRKFTTSVEKMVTYATFRGIPPESEIQELQTLFLRNHRLGLAYLKVRTVGLGMIVAFATLTGGAQVPKSLFFGDMQPNDKAQMTCLADALPELESIAPDCDPLVYHILSKGRVADTTFDQRNAPVSAFVYGTLGEAGLATAFEHCVHPMTKESSWTLLESLPYPLVETVGHGVSSVAISRAGLVNAILNELAARTQQSKHA